MEQQLCTELQFYEGAFSSVWNQTNSIFRVQLLCQVKSGLLRQGKQRCKRCYATCSGATIYLSMFMDSNFNVIWLPDIKHIIFWYTDVIGPCKQLNLLWSFILCLAGISCKYVMAAFRRQVAFKRTSTWETWTSRKIASLQPVKQQSAVDEQDSRHINICQYLSKSGSSQGQDHKCPLLRWSYRSWSEGSYSRQLQDTFGGKGTNWLG